MKTILIIDDDEDDRLVLHSVLESVDRNMLLKSAADGLEALRLLQTDMLVFPDFIFLDLNMPKLDGFGFLKSIKKITGLKTIPIVIYTTSSQERDVVLCRQLGADYFVTKPSRIVDIQSIVQHVLANEIAAFHPVRHLRGEAERERALRR